MFQGGILTPKDYSSYYKNILHRAFLTRNRMPTEDGSTKCRCCGAAVESLSHFPHCPCLCTGWSRLLDLVDEKPNPRAILLGIGSGGQVLPRGWLALWLLLWKFIIISLTHIGIGNHPSTTKTPRGSRPCAG